MILTELGIFQKFNCINEITGKQCRATREDVDHVFVFSKRKRKYGQRYTNQEFESTYSIIEPKDATQEWHKRITRAIKCIENTGLWSQKLPVLKNMLSMTWEDHQAILRQYWNYAAHPVDFTTPEWTVWFQKYPFLQVIDSDGKPYIDNTYFFDGSDVKLKSMYFGRFNKSYKDDIKNAILSKTPYSIYRLPAGYDVSFEFNPDKNIAYYSEEYRGCGNGHYYLALDHNTAWFIEND